MNACQHGFCSVANFVLGGQESASKPPQAICKPLSPIQQKMKVTPEKEEKVANMIFGSIYPLYLNKLEKKGRTKEELDQVMCWFLGFDQKTLEALINEKATYRTVFQKAEIHPNAYMIKGVVCGYRIEEIEDEFELYKQCRQMEKLIDELAKGRKMEKILREENKVETGANKT